MCKGDLCFNIFQALNKYKYNMYATMVYHPWGPAMVVSRMPPR